MLEKFLRTSFFGMVSICLVFAVLFGAVGGDVSAQEVTPSDYQPRAYLVTVSTPDPQQLDLPKFKDRDEALEFSSSLMLQRLQQTLAELRRMQDAGLIRQVELMSDLPFIRIAGVEEAAFPMIEKIGTVGEIVDDTGEPGTCLLKAAENLPDRLLAFSQAAEAHTSRLDDAGLNPAPVIEIYGYRYQDTIEWHIFTTVPANVEAKLEIWRNGGLVGSSYTLSGSDGFVNFYPEYYSCPNEHYSWALVSGDTVKIIAGGQTKQTTYAPITGWANPDTNIVFGTTLPGRTVKAWVYSTDPEQPCTSVEVSKQGTADASGNFSINMTSVVDFTQGGSFRLESLDSAGNYTYAYGDGYYFYPYPGDTYFYLYHQPNKNFTVTLKRANTVISTVNGTTTDTGVGNGDFSAVTQVGDIATLTVGGDTFIRTVYMMTLPVVSSFDPATGALVGTGLPGQKFFVDVYQSSSIGAASCYGQSTCQSYIIDAGGNFNINIGPVNPEFQVYIYLFSPGGELWGVPVYDEPKMAAYPIWDEVLLRGYYTTYPTVTLKSSGGAIKETTTATDYYRWRTYYAQFSQDMVAGDKIEVTDGVNFNSMTVGDLRDVRLNYNTDRLSGKATGRQIIADVDGYNGDSFSYCTTHNLGAATTFDLPIPVVKGDYQGGVDLIGTDGSKTSMYAFSLDLNVWVNSTSLRGYTETTGQTVNWELWRGGSKIDSGVDGSNPGSTYFWTSYSQVPQSGDELRVTTGDGNSASLIYPTITAQVDYNARTVSGKGIAGRRGLVNFYRHTPDGYYSSSLYWYPYSGNNYLVHMPAEMYWSRDCTPIKAGYPCGTVGAYTWTVENFWAINWPDTSPAIAADAFEGDNTKELAKAYTGSQAHSLHLYDDEDWVKFTVTQQDVDQSREFWFRTYDLGWDFDLKMELRAPDGITMIAEAGAEGWNGMGPGLEYTFSAPGTYYLRLHSTGYTWDYDGGYCDSKYTLNIMVDPKFIYLPAVLK